MGGTDGTAGGNIRAVTGPHARPQPGGHPRNHRVEEALTAATRNNDFKPLKRLLAALASPFEDRPENAAYRDPQPFDPGYRTFCGT